MRKPVVVLAALLLLTLAACTGDERAGPTSSPTPGPWHGGTLRVTAGSPTWIGVDLHGAPMQDPKVGDELNFALYRCCLARTLFAFSGRSAAEGGTVPMPDLASGEPEISADGLTWTIHLKEGIRFAPPFEGIEITAQDIVRGLERPFRYWGYKALYTAIVGFPEFRRGEADSISGLEVPDDHTLVIRLSEPTGDLPYRFALPATAPIPEGAADGHELDYARFLVASGPYMIEGADALDPSLPASEQQPAVGYVPPELDADAYVVERGFLALVRNPSWSPSTDDLRPAYPDRIEVTIIRDDEIMDPASFEEKAADLAKGALDLHYHWGITALSPDDPPYRVVTSRSNTVWSIPVNAAVPPFDDVHVRRAFSLALDRAAIASEALDAELTWHLVPDSAEAGLLASYQPSSLSADGDLEAARAEMRLSRYDRDGDGRCEGQVCRGIRVLAVETGRFFVAPSWEPIRRALGAIGMEPQVHTTRGIVSLYLHCDPAERWALVYTVGTGAVAGSDVFPSLFASGSIDANHLGMLGATPEQLESWGYSVTDVPNVDDRIDACFGSTGRAQFGCWAELEQYLMEKIVPGVPLVVNTMPVALSDRVATFSWDQANEFPALDRIALVPGSA